MTMTLHDYLAAVFSVILLVSVVAIVILGHQVPEILTGAFGAALGYVFRGALDGVTIRRNGQ